MLYTKEIAWIADLGAARISKITLHCPNEGSYSDAKVLATWVRNLNDKFNRNLNANSFLVIKSITPSKGLEHNIATGRVKASYDLSPLSSNGTTVFTSIRAQKVEVVFKDYVSVTALVSSETSSGESEFYDCDSSNGVG